MKHNEDTEAMVQHWHHLRGLWRANLRTSVRTYVDVEVCGGWGLPLSNGQPLLAHEDGTGWADVHIAHMKSIYDAHEGEMIALPQDNVYALLSFPGGYTFGHWYIDVCPRLETLSKFFDLGRLKYLVPGPLPSWAAVFIQAYGIKPEQLVELGDDKIFTVGCLVVPDLVRNSDYLPPFPHLAAFRTLRENLAPKPVDGQAATTGPRDQKLFVIHSPMTSAGSRRTLSNVEELKSILEARGFRTVEPAFMSFAEQVALFSSARLIVGEDSSALHNVIFSDDAALYVINGGDRMNYLHMSVCNLLGHDCCYQICEADGPQSFTCDPGPLINWLESAAA